MDKSLYFYKKLSPLDLYNADQLLEEDIQIIIQNHQLTRKEQLSKLIELEKSISNIHLKSHVQYYYDSLKPNSGERVKTFISFAVVIVFFLYTLFQLIQKF